MRFAISFIVLGLFSYAYAGELKNFEYRIEGYPKQEKNCNEVALELAERVEQAAKVKVLSARCMSEGADGSDYSFRYQAESKLPMVSTDLRGIGLAPKGQFKTREACEAVLVGEVAEFDRETGLKSFLSYCRKDSIEPRNPWFVRIDGFGEAKRAPYLSGFIYFAVPLKISGAEYRRLLTEGLAKQGANLRLISQSASLGYGHLGLLYYSDREMRFDMSEPTRHLKESECLQQEVYFQSVLKTLKKAPIISYCAKGGLGMFEMNLLFEGGPSYEVVPSVEKFKTHDECMTSRDLLVETYKIKFKRPVIGGLCSYQTGGGYAVSLFEVPNK